MSPPPATDASATLSESDSRLVGCENLNAFVAHQGQRYHREPGSGMNFYSNSCTGTKQVADDPELSSEVDLAVILVMVLAFSDFRKLLRPFWYGATQYMH